MFKASCLIFPALFLVLVACSPDEKKQNTADQPAQTEESDLVYDPYLQGCESYTTVYDKTERVSRSVSNRFIGVYGFVAADSMCLDRLYEDANNLVPPDTAITKQNTYFILVKNKTSFVPVTSLNQIMASDSLKNAVLAMDDGFGDNIKHFPFRKL